MVDILKCRQILEGTITLHQRHLDSPETATPESQQVLMSQLQALRPCVSYNKYPEEFAEIVPPEELEKRRKQKQLHEALEEHRRRLWHPTGKTKLVYRNGRWESVPVEEFTEGPQVVTVSRIGPIRVIRAPLPADIKGVTLKGVPQAPILITSEDIPGVKVERVVSHELGHRLRDQILKRAILDDRELFLRAPDADRGLARYLINQDLDPRKLDLRHSEVKPHIDRIFQEEFITTHNSTPGQLIAQEFIAEVFGCWAANTCEVPAKIDRLFTQVASTQELAAFKIEERTSRWALLGVGVILAVLLLNGQRR